MKKIITLSISLLLGITLLIGYQKISSKELSFKGSLPTTVNLMGTETANEYLDTSTTTAAVEFGAEMDLLSVNLLINASGTESVWLMPFFSNDEGCGSSTDANISWATRGLISESGSVATVSASSTFPFTSPQSGKHRVNFNITNFNSRCVKFMVWNNRYDLTTQGTPSSTGVWLELQAKELN